MRLARRRKQGVDLALEAYGVGVRVILEDPEFVKLVEPRLPPGHRRVEPSKRMPTLELRRDSDGGFDVLAGGVPVTGSAELEVALRVLDAQIRAEVAFHSHAVVFVHSGAVGHRGRAILLPGPSFSGKTTLVAALVRAGATYYSDEFAVLDDDGRVHPYPKPLSMRAAGARWGESSTAEELGGASGDAPLPVGTIVVTQYRPRQSFEPELRSSGQGAMALVGNAIPARARPAQVMAATRRAADGAVVLQGDRGDADAAAHEILARSERMAAAQ